MKKLLVISLLSVCLTIKSTAQGIYDSLDIKTFREHTAFNQKINIENFNSDLLNAAIFYATNEIRKKHKLSILKYNSALEKAANLHSADMAKNNFFSHTNSKNKKHKEPEDRAKIAGIQNPHIAENIIEGFILEYTANDRVIPGDPGVFYRDEKFIPIEARTYLQLADEMLKMWMDSEGHRANILAKDAVELGCGCALFYMKDFNHMPCVKATQNFQWYVPVISGSSR